MFRLFQRPRFSSPAGTLTRTAVYPREVMALALVFVHNHPSGDPAPSPEDRKLTRDLVWAARFLGVHVLDRIINGNNRY